MSLFGNSVSQEAVDTKFLQIGAPGEDLLDRAHRVFQECMLENKIKPDQKGLADDDDLTPLFQYGPKEGPPIFRKECSRSVCFKLPVYILLNIDFLSARGDGQFCPPER